MESKEYHEPFEQLPQDVIEYHRIIKSVIEELEAVDWYNQRAALCMDSEAKAILEHNRDEEIEHACMGLEWLRRNNPVWDEMLREFLFTKGSIVAAESSMGESGEEDTETEVERQNDGSLNLGKLQ